MAQQEQKKPNILVIWGDDIGISNLSCYSHGLMGYQTPNIDRLAKEGMMFTDAYRGAKLHGGPFVLHHRAELLPHRPFQGRHTGLADRPAAGGPDDRRAAQATRLRDGAVRQEPPRRPEQVPSHCARL